MFVDEFDGPESSCGRQESFVTLLGIVILLIALSVIIRMLMLSSLVGSHNSNNPLYPSRSTFVGQYAFLDCFGVNSSDLDTSFWKMEYSNDFLWTVSPQSNVISAQNDVPKSVVKRLPLLPTTEKLLHVLLYPVPNEDSFRESSTMAEKSRNVDEIDNIAQLKHVENLTDVIQRALSDLRTIRRNGLSSAAVSGNKGSGGHHNRRKKKHTETKKDNNISPDTHENEDALAPLAEVHLDEIDDDELPENDQSSNPAETSEIPLAWFILAAALNSLRLITPLILNMVWHEKRNDSELQIGSIKLEKVEDRRRAKCWLIGSKVFVVSTVRQCEFIWNQLHDIFHLLGIPTEDVQTGKKKTPEQLQQVTTLYMNLLHSLMKELVMGFSAATAHSTSPISLGLVIPSLSMTYHRINIPVSTSPSWIHKHPFDELDENDQRKLQAVACSIDMDNGLIQESASIGSERKDAEEKAAYVKAIRNLHDDLSTLLTKRFPGARLSIYGSCLSDLSLGKNADVDLSLYIEELAYSKNEFEAGRITEEMYRSVVKQYVFKTHRILEGQRNKRFSKLQPVTRARVPVVKGTCLNAGNPHSLDGSLDFDICFINDIAVSNSELIRQYSLVSESVKSLMIAVKCWAKAQKISSSQDNTISSYAWMNLVVFYLQNVGLVPNLQCRDLLHAVKGVKASSKEYWDTVNNLDTRFLTWEEASNVWNIPENRKNISVSTLLYGFFEFYTLRFPTALYTISIRNGASLIPKAKTSFERTSFFWCIEDPFEIAESHCPHDLGMHANETGACTIVGCMRTAEAFLRKQLFLVLDAESDSDFIAPNIESLWQDEQSGRFKRKEKLPPKNDVNFPPLKVADSPVTKPGPVTNKPGNRNGTATQSGFTKRRPKKKPPASANMNGHTPVANRVVASEGTKPNVGNPNRLPKNNPPSSANTNGQTPVTNGVVAAVGTKPNGGGPNRLPKNKPLASANTNGPAPVTNGVVTAEGTKPNVGNPNRLPKNKPPASANTNGQAPVTNGVVAAEGTRPNGGGPNRRYRKPQMKQPQREHQPQTKQPQGELQLSS